MRKRYVRANERDQGSAANVLEAGDMAAAASTHTFIFTTHPNVSTPTKGSTPEAVRAKPISNANPSSVRSQALMTPPRMTRVNPV